MINVCDNLRNENWIGNKKFPASSNFEKIRERERETFGLLCLKEWIQQVVEIQLVLMRNVWDV